MFFPDIHMTCRIFESMNNIIKQIDIPQGTHDDFTPKMKTISSYINTDYLK